jgi:membrane fusion protein (multidrug efflux system)
MKCSSSRGAISAAVVLIAAAMVSGCGAVSKGDAAAGTPTAAVRITVGQARQQPVNRVLRVTGTLMADEEAEVAAETAGRVIATPVERGSRVVEGSPLIVIAALEAQAGATDAEASVAQLEARLALEPGETFDVESVPEVASAKATRDLAEADFNRIKSLLDQRVVSQAEFDQRRTALEASRNQYRAARNAAQQQFRMLEGARARLTLARKALADTVVKSPFAGLVVERKVSIGDFVTRGTKIATVVKVAPLRVELTVPEQSAGLIARDQPVRIRVDAFPGRDFDGRVRYVSPAFRADQRALTVEAVVPNADNALKPGMYVAADIQLPASDASVVVPVEAVQSAGGISRVYVVKGAAVEERMVTPGMALGPLVEILGGVAAGEQVATSGIAGLVDGTRIQIVAAAAAPATTSRPSAAGSR